jgi:S-adenosylmethionine:tRNA ribosyltransferase-isomerase
VTRALEHAAGRPGGLRAGDAVATNRLGPTTRLRVVDTLVSGTHEPGVSHHHLLRAFVTDQTLARVDDALESSGYRTHEFGDSVFVEAAARGLAEDGAGKAALVLGF